MSSYFSGFAARLSEALVVTTESHHLQDCLEQEITNNKEEHLEHLPNVDESEESFADMEAGLETAETLGDTETGLETTETYDTAEVLQ